MKRILILVGLLLLVAVIPLVTIFGGGDELIVDKSEPEAIPKPEPEPEPGCLTWESVEGNHTDNRWFGDGIVSILEAETREDARDAAYEFLGMVKHHPNLLVATTRYFLDREVEVVELFDREDCATDEAEVLVAELEIVLITSDISVDDAPSNGYNSGVDEDGTAGVSAHPGITGDRRAIKIVKPDGTVIWIMGRCGNIVVIKPPPDLPKVPTDEPPPKEVKDSTRDVLVNPDAPARGPSGGVGCGDKPCEVDAPEADPDRTSSTDYSEPPPPEPGGYEQPDSSSGGGSPGGGDDSVVSKPDEDADDNPEKDDSEESSSGTSSSTSNDADSDDAKTSESDETNQSGDPGAP